MNHQEIREIQKTLEIDHQNITKICGCYVDGGRNILGTWESSFLALKEEEQFRYLDIFKKCLSGHIDRQLFNVIAPDITEQTATELKEVRDSGCKDPDILMERIYEPIIGMQDIIDGNYLILCLHAVYDIPGKTSDGQVMEDASDYVYDHILICICPVSLSKPELGPEENEKPFGRLDRRWILKKPEIAILYPAFNDRLPDTDAALVYARALNREKKEFLYSSFGIRIPNTPEEETKMFNRIMEEVLGAEATVQDIQAVTDEIWELAEGHKGEAEKLDIDRMRDVLEAAGLTQKQLDRIPGAYVAEGMGADAGLSLNNIVRRGKSVINTECGSLRLEDYARDRVLIREVEGRPYLCLELEPGNIQVNGIEMRVGSKV